MIDPTDASFVKIEIERPAARRFAGKIVSDRPALLVLGGADCTLDSYAHKYAMTIAGALGQNGITENLDIYAVKYQFANKWSEWDTVASRIRMFREYGYDVPAAEMNNICMPDPTFFPNYLTEIYDFAFEPLIFDNNDNPLPYETVLGNFKKRMIFAYCHGAYVMNRMSDKLGDEMANHFTAEQIATIKQQLFVINHAPFAPMGRTGFTKISFFSASDPEIKHYNEFHNQLKIRAKDKFAPTFFSGEFGNMVVADQVNTNGYCEHTLKGFAGAECDFARLTDNGRIFFDVEHNALAAGADAMISKRALPDTEQMLTTPQISFAEMAARGAQIQQQIQCHR